MVRGFPRQARLTRPWEFARVFESGCRVPRPTLQLLGLRNGLGYARLGLAVSKRNVPRAVDRNRVKRLIRESFRIHQDLIKGLDVIVMARRGVAELDNRSLHTHLHRYWEDLARRCENS